MKLHMEQGQRYRGDPNTGFIKRRIQKQVRENRQKSKPGKQSRSAIIHCRDKANGKTRYREGVSRFSIPSTQTLDCVLGSSDLPSSTQENELPRM